MITDHNRQHCIFFFIWLQHAECQKTIVSRTRSGKFLIKPPIKRWSISQITFLHKHANIYCRFCHYLRSWCMIAHLRCHLLNFFAKLFADTTLIGKCIGNCYCADTKLFCYIGQTYCFSCHKYTSTLSLYIIIVVATQINPNLYRHVF